MFTEPFFIKPFLKLQLVLNLYKDCELLLLPIDILFEVGREYLLSLFEKKRTDIISAITMPVNVLDKFKEFNSNIDLYNIIIHDINKLI